MLEILERICAGQGEEGDVEKLIRLGLQIKETSLCGLGQTAPNPVLSTIRHFRKEYDQHIRERHCEAGVCPSLVRASCQTRRPDVVLAARAHLTFSQIRGLVKHESAVILNQTTKGVLV